MPLKEKALRWLRQAKEDIATAEIDFERERFYASAFWCQQAVEKAFKSLLIFRGEELPKFHDVKLLAKKCAAPEHIVEKSAYVNPYYLEARYIDYSDDLPAEAYKPEEAAKAIKYAKEIIAWVETKLK